MYIFFLVVVMHIIKSKLTFVNRTSFYINDFFFESSFSDMLFSFRIWDVVFFWTAYCSLSLESVTAKYSRAIMVANYFYPKTEAGKVSSFVCLSESVVQIIIDSLHPPSGVAVPRLKVLELWPAFLILWACIKSFSLWSAARHIPWTCLSLMEKELWNGVVAGSDSDFTGLLAVHCEMREVWTGSRSPAQLVGVPAVVICSVPALFLPHLDSRLPSRSLCT